MMRRRDGKNHTVPVVGGSASAMTARRTTFAVNHTAAGQGRQRTNGYCSKELVGNRRRG